MKPNQKLTEAGYQVSLFPMETLRITQGRYNNFSHKGYNATDLAGKDGGIDLLYAPFDLRTEWIERTNAKTGAVFSNAKAVILANGKKIAARTIMMMLWHNNNIKHLYEGLIIPQGHAFYAEGTAGFATGNHVHMELAYGKYIGGYPLFKLPNGYWTLIGTELNIEDCFFINDTKVANAGGYKFKTYKAPKPPVKPPAAGKEKYKVGDTVNYQTLSTQANGGKLVNSYYKTGKINSVFTGAKYPYRIEVNKESIGFVNDKMITSQQTTPVAKKEYVILSKNVGSWNLYKTNVAPRAGNQFAKLSPYNIGRDLEYEILARPQANVATIKTQDFGIGNIWIGPDTKAVHKIVWK